MQSSHVITREQVDARMQNDEVRRLLKFIVSRQLQVDDYDKICSVAASLPDVPGRTKMALLYLEDAQWNLRDALFHIELDTADRENGWVVEEGSGQPGTNQQYNSELDRRLARLGEEIGENLFVVTYKTADGAELMASFPVEARRQVKKDDQDSVDDLNRWRRSALWHCVGPETGMLNSHGEKWHSLQETFVRNRFALVDDTKPDFKGIYKDYVAVFEGVLLPGRVEPCGPRSQTAITSYLHREVIDKADGVIHPKTLTRDLKHSMAKNRLRTQWNLKVAGRAVGLR